MRRLSLTIIILILLSAAAPALAAPADITVKVLYPDGSPAAGISVMLQNGNYAGIGNATTNGTGIVSFDVEPGSKAVRAVIAKYNVTSLWQEAGNRTIVVRLPQAGEVTGTVKLDGMAAGNPIIVLDDADMFDSTPYDVSRQNSSYSYTFTANRFSFSTSVGGHSIYAVGYSNGIVYMSDRLAINVSESGQPVVLELKPAGSDLSVLSPPVYDRIFHTSESNGSIVSMAGTLIGADGRPLANATLIAQDYFLKEPGTTTTDANGTFSFNYLNVSTDIVRFKAVIVDNGTQHISYSSFYPVQNTASLEVRISDYPGSSVGYIYGIIAMTANRSNPVPISGTVYVSNGMSEYVTPDNNNGQFLFTLAPGTYDIYAEHVDGGQHLVSSKVRITVKPEWSPLAVDPTVLVVEPGKVQYAQLAIALAIGALCIAGAIYAMRKWL